MSDLNEILHLFPEAVEQPCAERSNISVREKGVRYTAKVNPRRETAVLQVDGKIITNGQKCDKLILSRDSQNNNLTNGHFIELKGCDIRHAVSQLENTITNNQFRFINKKYARIVGHSFPASKGDPILERARTRWKRDFQCELKTLKNNQPDLI